MFLAALRLYLRSLSQVLVLVPVRLSLCLALLWDACRIFFCVVMVVVALEVFLSACHCGSAFGRATLVVVRYLLRVRVFWLHFVLDAFSDVVFAALLQSPPSSCDAVSLFLMLLSLALSVPLHPRLFVSFVL